MKCYSHPHSDAVASCASCGQGLCGECVKRTTGGEWVCGERCQKGVSIKNLAVEFEVENVRLQYRSYMSLATLCRAMALILILIVIAMLGAAAYQFQIRGPGRME